MQKRSWMILLCAVVMISAALSAYLYFELGIMNPSAQEAAKKKAEKSEALILMEKRRAAARAFEIELNSFIKELAENVAALKRKRLIIQEMVRFDHVRSEEYIEDNLNILQMMVPEIANDMDTVMQLFRDADLRFQELFGRYEVIDQAEAMEKWRGMRERQFDIYSQYFMLEQDMISAHIDLLMFYHENFEKYSSNLQRKFLYFDDPGLVEYEKLLKQKIDFIYNKQHAILYDK